jgi:hypothetical protein
MADSDARTHHRVVVAVETSAAAVEFFPIFKKIVLNKLIGVLSHASFEVRADILYGVIDIPWE